MGFVGVDDLVNDITNNGNFIRSEWNKITGASAYAVNRWYDFSSLSGTPVANSFAGTALNWVTCTETTGNGTDIFGIPHSGNVSPATKHILSSSCISSSGTGVPGVLMLVDLQGYWPGISVNSASAQTLTGTPTLRYANGVGVKPFFVITTASGATAHNISLSYTNQAGTTGRSLPVTVGMTASAIPSHIAHSGSGGSNYGPFLPLANGDTGVQNVASVTFSAASGAGAGALCLARPLLTIPLTTLNVLSERDYLNQLPSLPKVVDGACLVWLYTTGASAAASSSFYGSVEFGWG